MHSSSINNRINQSLQDDEKVDEGIDNECDTHRYRITELPYAIIANQHVCYHSGHPTDYEASLEIASGKR